MNTELEEITQNNNTIYEKIRLDESYATYYQIIDKKLPYKFSYLDEWLLKQSKLLNKESMLYEKQKNNYKIKEQQFRTYKRGTIIKVDFGVGIGSEMSQVHFAVVLNNYDNPRNNVLTVLPLTSKKSKFNLPLGTCVIDKLVEHLQIQINMISFNKPSLKEILKAKKIQSLIEYYKTNIKSTFACCSLITTISKERIFPPKNEYDIIGKVRCSTEVMNKIDKEIKKTILYSVSS